MHLGSVMGLYVGKNARAVQDTAGFWILCTEMQARQSRMTNCLRAHCAGLQRHPKRAPFQPVGPNFGASNSDRENLGMCGRIQQFPRAIPGLSENIRSSRDDGPDRDFAAQSGSAGLGQGKGHERAEHPSFLPVGLDARKPLPPAHLCG